MERGSGRRAVGAAALLFAVLAGPAHAATAPAQAQEAPLQELPPQTLSAGQCALALWTRASPAKRVFMAFNRPALARIQTGGRTLELALQSRDGAETYGHAARETFKAGGVEVTTEIEIEPRGGLLSGAVVSSGTLEYKDPAGWSVVLPVAGLLACQS